MYSDLLCFSVVTCIVVCFLDFNCEFSCLAPYLFVSQESGVYIVRRLPGPFSAKRLLVRQLEVWFKGVPFRGRTRGGESERGRNGKS